MSQAPPFTPQEIATINRSVRLKNVLQQEGWPELVKISEAITKQALDEMDAYTGTDEGHMARLTFIWKTLKTHHAKFLATIEDQIEKGNALLLRNAPAAARPATQSETAIAFPVVRPACDIPAGEPIGETEN